MFMLKCSKSRTIPAGTSVFVVKNKNWKDFSKFIHGLNFYLSFDAANALVEKWNKCRLLNNKVETVKNTEKHSL